MCKFLFTVSLFLLCLFPLLGPQSLYAEVPQTADVVIKNFPETQQIKGDVHVVNLPEVQQVRGSVTVEGTTKYIVKEGLVVPTSQRAELSEMVYAGTIDTDGFTSLLISVQGEMRTDAYSSGTIGVLLVPDEKSILRIMRDAKRVQFPLECKVQTKNGDPIYFESEQVQQRIGFARYKMFLYNTSNKSAEANVYLYLSNSPTVNVRGVPGN